MSPMMGARMPLMLMVFSAMLSMTNPLKLDPQSYAKGGEKVIPQTGPQSYAQGGQTFTKQSSAEAGGTTRTTDATGTNATAAGTAQAATSYAELGCGFCGWNGADNNSATIVNDKQNWTLSPCTVQKCQVDCTADDTCTGINWNPVLCHCALNKVTCSAAALQKSEPWMRDNTHYEKIDNPTSASTSTTMSTCNASGSSSGDPHVTNVFGERFDIKNDGWHTFLQIPRLAGSHAISLKVVGKVQQRDGDCEQMYLQGVNVSGTWLRQMHDLNFTVGHLGDLTVNGVSSKETQYLSGPMFNMTPELVELHMGGMHVTIDVERAGCCYTYLNFKTAALRSAVANLEDIGGLIGADDYTPVTRRSEHCAKHMNLPVAGNQISFRSTVRAA